MLSVTISFSVTMWCCAEDLQQRKVSEISISLTLHINNHQAHHPHEEQETTIVVFVWLVPAASQRTHSSADVWSSSRAGRRDNKYAAQRAVKPNKEHLASQY